MLLSPSSHDGERGNMPILTLSANDMAVSYPDSLVAPALATFSEQLLPPLPACVPFEERETSPCERLDDAGGLTLFDSVSWTTSAVIEGPRQVRFELG